jgi:hypothetical protein
VACAAHAPAACDACPDCGIHGAASWRAHDTGCATAAKLRASEPPERPLVRFGDVLLTLAHEVQGTARDLQALTAFQQRVMDAANAGAARWMHLFRELTAADAPGPEPSHPLDDLSPTAVARRAQRASGRTRSRR